ncbi:MAG: FMN-binding protein [Lachnospiraceae bacterium]|nr:FMN-binding protein [Lachnospiraceae bacterium]
MPDLSNVQDGNYIGAYSIAPVHVKAEVSVSNHQITNIAILQHDNGLGSAAECIINDVVEEQSLDIDAVAGATVSSKCILKAVENAIEN